MSELNERYPLMTLELTSDEQISLLGFIVNFTNKIIADGDKNNWLPDLERIEEKIRDWQAGYDHENPPRPILSNYH